MTNIELLERTMQHIKDHPEVHNQRYYLAPTPECGTAACFAGWACLLSGYTEAQLSHADLPIPAIAIILLGIDITDAAILFDPANNRRMLELMVKDLVNGDQIFNLQGPDFYREKVHSGDPVSF